VAGGERRELALWERSEVSREGVTCITCHRINEEYGRVNGERRVVPGEIFDPMSGAGDGAWLATGVIVCPGVTIGDDAVVGAGSVVTKDLPPRHLCFGNPCRVVREL